MTWCGRSQYRNRADADLIAQEKYPNQEIPAAIKVLLFCFTPAPPGSPIWVVSRLHNCTRG